MLTAATNVQGQSLYTAFGNKDALFHTALAAYCHRQIDGLADAAASAATAWEAAVAIALYQDPGRLGLRPWGCMLARAVAERGRRDQRVRELAARTYTATVEALRAHMDRALQRGEIAPIIPLAELVEAGYAYSQAMAQLRATAPDDAAFEPSRAHARRALDALAGLGR
ncbi:TetR family transcriptional regulator C-terminal domain-containing protein [Marinitenerispora sediminis]|uniref:Tetracyclin repressor-like C-terminal domain-containing protein n=1 Tax=Marinitenerispora sediminis TaxID=1931232 RepID=A0A368T5H5_9ACTN|nr:hypothetical protein [Marinitenerispora sediminis]RCV56297.1 hypothetical protein DEF28_04070 [Marinitenerispora sediminis]RCV58592.1 hypothetical protein DEF24_13000 [Marinitenerispora sediminis]RCV61229.1 hypothetical protein DEF23_02985 [Marinitenerispora sediminis]